MVLSFCWIGECRILLQIRLDDLMKNYEDMAVIFMDLLGSQAKNDFAEKFKIHNIFHTEMKRAEERKNARQTQHVIYDRRIYSFSDCVYIFYFYKPGIEEYRKKNDELLKVALLNSLNPIMKIMLSGNFVRGGATIGKCYIDDLGFFGPAVNRAYKIESEIAELPIIEIDNEIGRRIYKEQIENSQTFIYDWKPSIISEKSGKYFLNYMYQLEINSPLYYENEEYDFDTVKEDILRNVFDNKAKHPQSEKILKKMTFLEEWLQTEKCAKFSEKVIPMGSFTLE